MRRSLFSCALLLSGALLAGCNDSTLSGNNNLGCDRVHSVSLGSSTSGTLDTSDCQLGDGSAVDYYRFRISSSRNVSVNMSSSIVDSYVAIVDEFGSLVADEGTGGSGFSQVNAFLPAGTYYIAASTFAAGDYGSYSLDTASD
jgi:hypothetical protein